MSIQKNVIAIVSPDSAPMKRLVQKAKEEGVAIDATQGRKTKAVLIMENSPGCIISAFAGNNCRKGTVRQGIFRGRGKKYGRRRCGMRGQK